MRRNTKRASLWQRTLPLAAALWAVMPAGAVMADDAGVRAFLREEFGSPAAQSSYDPFQDGRPIIVRPHRRTASRKPQTRVAVGPIAPVSIYDDPTLRPGDAVMTTKGLRVFMGGHAAPYSDADFVALSEADGLPRQLEKALVVIDKSPRG